MYREGLGCFMVGMLQIETSPRIVPCGCVPSTLNEEKGKGVGAGVFKGGSSRTHGKKNVNGDPCKKEDVFAISKAQMGF